MSKLYEVEVHFRVYVVAESKDEAEDVGKEAIMDGQEEPEDSWAAEAKSVGPLWEDAIPYNTGTDHTCKDWLEGEAVQG